MTSSMTSSSSSSMSRSMSSSDAEDWKTLSSADLWKKIVADADAHFLWKFAKDESIDSFCASTHASRVSLLRNFCLKIGLQLQLRDYAFDSLGNNNATATAAANGTENGAASTSPTRGADNGAPASPNPSSNKKSSPSSSSP